jgi:hypothetical protein
MPAPTNFNDHLLLVAEKGNGLDIINLISNYQANAANEQRDAMQAGEFGRAADAAANTNILNNMLRDLGFAITYRMEQEAKKPAASRKRSRGDVDTSAEVISGETKQIGAGTAESSSTSPENPA